MEFKKERVYSAVNADELRAGDKVIVADDLDTLKRCVKDNSPIDTLRMVGNEDYLFRFGVKDNCVSFALAYLVERNENCTNCERLGKTCNSREDDKITCCFDYKPKTEPHYRPFRDTDELVKVWGEKHMELYPRPAGTMPLIWVRQKECSKGGLLITYFGEDEVKTDMGFMTMSKLLSDYIFTDGSPCGVEA